MAMKLEAGVRFPEITVAKLGGGNVVLGSPSGDKDWQAVIVYRGKHCPLCSKYLKQLETLIDQFSDLGVDVVVVSADPEEKAQAHIAELGVDLAVGYDLSIKQMQQLGVYISHPRSAKETDRPFAEPGLFVINGEGNLQLTDISNGPFVRPDLEALLRGLKFIRNPENNYPIRGTYS